MSKSSIESVIFGKSISPIVVAVVVVVDGTICWFFLDVFVVGVGLFPADCCCCCCFFILGIAFFSLVVVAVEFAVVVLLVEGLTSVEVIMAVLGRILGLRANLRCALELFTL